MKFSPLLLSCTAFLSLTQSAFEGGIKGAKHPAVPASRMLKKIDGPQERECEFCKLVFF